MNILELHFNSKEHLSQVFSFETSWGALYVIAELQNPLPASKKFLSQLAELIHKEFVACAEGSKRKKPAPDACLKTALRKANTFLSQEVKKGNVQWVGNLNIAVLVLTSDSAYFTKSGGMRFWISRGGSFTDAGKKLEESPADPPKIFGAMSTGKIAEGDRLLVVTKDLLASLKKEETWNKLASLENDKDFKKAFKGKENDLSGLLFSAFLPSSQEEPRSLAHRKLPSLSALHIPSIPSLAIPQVKIPKIAEIRFPVSRTALIAVLFLCVLGVGFFVFQRGNQELQDAKGDEVRVEVLMRQADIALEDRREKEAGALLQEAWQVVSSNAISGNPLEARFAEFKAELETELADIFAIHSIASPSLLSDLSDAEGFEGTEIFIADSKLIAYNPLGAAFVSVDLDTKEAERIAAPHNLTLGTSGQTIPLFFAKPHYLLSFSEGSWEKKELALPSPGSDFVDLAEFKGNLYALDSQGNIFRYTDALKRNAAPASWIHPSSSPSRVPEAGDLSVDGNIWIASSNSILRFYKGVFREQIEPRLFPDLREIAEIETREPLPNLYVLDAEQNRLIVLTKFGELVAQYQSPLFTNLRDVALSPDGTRAYLLNGNQVYEISLE